MDRIIRTVDDFARLVGADEPTQPMISRRIYKDTDCGAWMQWQTETGRTRRISLDFRFRRSIAGFVVLARRGRREWINAIRLAEQGLSPKSLQTLKDALCLDSSGRIPHDTLPTFTLSALAAAIVENLTSAGWTVTGAGTCDRRAMLSARWTKAETFTPYKAPQVTGIIVGSIVEGCDGDATPFTLSFPFTVAEYKRHLAALEDQCDEMWHECNDEEEEE